MALKDVELRSSRGPGKRFDGGGLFAILRPDGRHWWRFRWRAGERERTLSLGVYPEVGLRAARERAASLRREIERGLDPSLERKVRRLRSVGLTDKPTFAQVAQEWQRVRGGAWSPSYAKKVEAILRRNLLPTLGPLACAEVTTLRLRAAIDVVSARGALELAGKTREVAGAVLRFAMAQGIEEVTDVAAPLRGALPVRKTVHHRKLERAQVGGFLRALTDYPGRVETRIAVELLARLAVRTHELRHAEWTQFDLDAAEWRIPAALMKARRDHLVPLPPQCLRLLDQLKALTGHRRHLFPGQGRTAVMSENTVNKAIALLGYADRVVGHGFRATFATIASESGRWPPDVIERHLAHAERNAVKAAYQRAEFLPERRAMMVWYSDLLDALRSGARTAEERS